MGLIHWDDVRDSRDSGLNTPFEDWCEAEGLHPEHPDAWDLFERSATTAPGTPDPSLGVA